MTNLLYKENRSCKVAAKTPNGITDRVNMADIVMQGSVLASLKCTAQQDMLMLTKNGSLRTNQIYSSWLVLKNLKVFVEIYKT